MIILPSLKVLRMTYANAKSTLIKNKIQIGKTFMSNYNNYITCIYRYTYACI